MKFSLREVFWSNFIYRMNEGFFLYLLWTDEILLSPEPNPHMGHLAWADAFVVTADSVSMISEVCSTGYG